MISWVDHVGPKHRSACVLITAFVLTRTPPLCRSHKRMSLKYPWVGQSFVSLLQH